MKADCHPQLGLAGPPRHRPRRLARLGGAQVIVWIALIVTLAAGCRRSEKLEVTYGQRKGSAANSVNGTSVLATMYERAGFKAYTWRYLSPRLRDYDTIVWTPDDFNPPGEEAQKFFERWLEDNPGKTLVYIGRDYDAASDYWSGVLPTAPADQQMEITRRLAQARSAHDSARMQMPTSEAIEWFAVRRDKPGRQATQLSGEWSQDIDVTQASISMRGLLEIPTEKDLLKFWNNRAPSSDRQPRYTALLKDGDTTLVSRVTKPAWRGGKIIVITNGSILLNLPLVNHQHRKLAMRLIQACEPAGKVAFLESGPEGPLTLDYAPKDAAPEETRKRVLLAAHWVVLGLLYCFCVFPIFGRPKSIESERDPEFDQHVDALATLLERTRDEPYARRQLDQYREGTGMILAQARSRTPLETEHRQRDSDRSHTL